MTTTARPVTVVTTQRAQRLPAPVPGVISKNIPLMLLPIYFAANRIEAMDRGEAQKYATLETKRDCVVMVKRSTE